MGEEDGVFVADELVEIDGTVGGLSIEVGCGRPEAEATGNGQRTLIQRTRGSLKPEAANNGTYLGRSSVAIVLERNTGIGIEV